MYNPVHGRRCDGWVLEDFLPWGEGHDGILLRFQKKTWIRDQSCFPIQIHQRLPTTQKVRIFQKIPRYGGFARGSGDRS